MHFRSAAVTSIPHRPAPPSSPARRRLCCDCPYREARSSSRLRLGARPFPTPPHPPVRPSLERFASCFINFSMNRYRLRCLTSRRPLRLCLREDAAISTRRCFLAVPFALSSLLASEDREIGKSRKSGRLNRESVRAHSPRAPRQVYPPC
jgi:hypothetical protein